MLYFATRENRLGFIFKYNIKFHKALNHLLLKPEATRSEKPCVIIKNVFSSLFFGKKASKVEAVISILGMRGKRESTGRRPNSLLMSAEASKECE